MMVWSQLDQRTLVRRGERLRHADYGPGTVVRVTKDAIYMEFDDGLAGGTVSPRFLSRITERKEDRQ